MRWLFQRLGITLQPGEEWKLMLPWISFTGIALVVIFAGMATGVSPALYTPMAVFFAVCFAGIPVAYMWGAAAHDDEDPQP